jgi:hypothetical protein
MHCLDFELCRCDCHKEEEWIHIFTSCHCRECPLCHQNIEDIFYENHVAACREAQDAIDSYIRELITF